MTTDRAWKNDVAVLFIFFARIEQTAAVFEQIKIARPRKLFLYQDGPRPEREDDIVNVQQCREIVSDIDWDCEVHTLFQEKNFGCDPSEFIAQKWMFDHVDKGIVLEDDDVPSQSFFYFCKEMLDKYENDTRFNIICGMNNIEEYDNGYSYFFTRYGSIWGWATWKRNIDKWDSDYRWIEDKHLCELLRKEYPNFDSWLEVCLRHKKSKREHYESIMGSYCRINNLLNIVPCKNMITNIGIATESTHSVGNIKLLPRAIRKVFGMKRHELTEPIKHPPYVVEDLIFNDKFEKLMGRNKLTAYSRKLESLLYRIFPFLG